MPEPAPASVAQPSPEELAWRAAVESALRVAVAAIGGRERAGQVAMAVAVAEALAGEEHLLVQAGTGTGKSLAYLVPAVLHEDRVVVATATIALQRQLVERDLPRLVPAVAPLLGRTPTYAILKGRQNYLCRYRLDEGAGGVPGGADAQDEPDLFDPAPRSRLGRDAARVRDWAARTGTGDRDELDPAPDERVWRAYSVSARECLGASRCPFADTCFSERARDRARRSDVVVTNHALLAIDALGDVDVLPDHEVTIVDEAHELLDRATGVATGELTGGMAQRAARRARRLVGEQTAARLAEAADGLGEALDVAPAGRVADPGAAPLGRALTLLRDACHAALADLAASGSPSPSSGDAPGSGSASGGAGSSRSSGGGSADDGVRREARIAVEEVHNLLQRLLAAGENDVVWLARPERRPPALHVAPLSVAGLLRAGLFAEHRVVLTSATLTLGGSFEPIAGSLGLVGPAAPAWRGLDVGTPFDMSRQGILYVAAHLPPPGRDGPSPEVLDELAGLIQAAGGRTLGLFSSHRAARAAADAMRERLDVAVLCQGDDAVSTLVRAFASDATTCLFGTLSLWQGVDVPGPACQLVVIDRIPFPRPDDPLASARSRAVDRAGGNGFLAVSATTAALLLAQGAGRLIRTTEDRGVVAVLDARMATAGYAGFLRRSLPPFYVTTDPAQVRRSLAAIDATAPPVVPPSPAVGPATRVAPRTRPLTRA